MMWQPIETAPKDGSFVLIFCPKFMIKRRIKVAQYDESYGIEWPWIDSDSTNIRGDMPTHWMPLPDPPND